MTRHIPRVGLQIGAGAPAWVQVREVLWQQARKLPLDLVEVDIAWSGFRSLAEQAEVAEDITVQDLDALIANSLSPYLRTCLLDYGLPIVNLVESAVRHPLLTAHEGLYAADHRLGTFLTQRLAGGTVLVVGGAMVNDEGSLSRLAGFYAALPADGRFTTHEVLTDWTYEDGLRRVTAYLADHPDLRCDAIFGAADHLALAARDAGQALGRVRPETVILGFNGDPLALAAIIDGSMTATMETDLDALAAQVLDLAGRAARGERLPPHFQTRHHLITADNAAAAAARRLVSVANLPTRLAAVTQRNEQQRVVQLETSLAIDRQVGLILDEEQLSLAISALIRDNYGFDAAQVLIWNAEAGRLVEVRAAGPGDAAGAAIAPDPAGPLAFALADGHPGCIPDVQASPRFPPDPAWPATRARVVVPVHLGGQIVGLLDLHNRRPAHYTRELLDGLQLLADQLGISMRNAELYSQALAGRAAAEQADRLKTVLLTYVSHELRTPLNVILGYSRAVLDTLAAGTSPPAADLDRDLGHIYGSGEHLLRLINDLLDLSRAEIDELQLLPEPLDTRRFLADLFRTSAAHFGAAGPVAWRLALPADLPPLTADPVRLRQVLLNLLHNAAKFTAQGEITLGAAVVATELHIWVADTGPGIAPELQAQVFEPFISLPTGSRPHEGIGLGLSIGRRLVALHGGRLTQASAPGQGSTFHVYLPLPAAAGAPGPLAAAAPWVLLAITATDPPPAPLIDLAARRGLGLCPLRPGDDLPRLLATTHPAALAWDLAVPVAAGWPLLQQVRADPRFAALPVILYHPLPGIAAPAVAGTATGLLLKPLPAGALVEAIHNLDPGTPQGRVLVVEDDPATRALYCRIIAEHLPGYHIDAAGDGAAALALLAGASPSLVVLDLALPGVDGFGVLAALRANPRLATVPVLVLSGQALAPADLERLEQARVVFQTKDVLSEDELAESLRRTLAREALLPPPTSDLVKRALAYIQQHYSEPLALAEIAAALGVSKHYLDRIFQRELGISPWEYLTRYRVLRAKELLRTTRYAVAEVGARVGFESASYFSRIFHREAGCSPRVFREQLSR